jgi:Mn2+/Fe2+ NRAMP family transporter
MEVSLDMGYLVSQAFGWNWSENQHPQEDARFSTTYTVCIFASSLLMMARVDPLKLTLFTMALTAAILPLVIIPFLILMNDEHYLGKHRNGFLSNAVIVFIIGLTFILAVVAIPLEIIGG